MVETRMRRHISRLPADAERRPHAQTYLAGAISAKGNYVVSAAHDGSLKLWDATGAEIASNQGAAAAVLAIGYDRTDENRLFSLHWDGTFILWEVKEPSS